MAVIVIVVGVILLVKRTPSTYGPNAPAGGAAAKPSGPVTREAAPQNVVVPSKDSKGVPQNVALPTNVSPASQTSDASFRGFSIKADNNEFIPNTVIVRQGDVADITVTAVDKDYDWSQPDYGFKTPIPKGTSKRIQFGATASGKFTFFCSVCGGPQKGPVGYLIVAQK